MTQRRALQVFAHQPAAGCAGRLVRLGRHQPKLLRYPQPDGHADVVARVDARQREGQQQLLGIVMRWLQVLDPLLPRLVVVPVTPHECLRRLRETTLRPDPQRFLEEHDLPCCLVRLLEQREVRLAQLLVLEGRPRHAGQLGEQ